MKRADQRYRGRGSPPHDVQFVGSRGSYVQGADGRRYVDFMTGWCVGNLGWDVREIRARLRRFGGPDYVHPSYLYGPWTELAQQLADITPGRLQRSYRATGGTEAVEIALQLLKNVAERGEDFRSRLHQMDFGSPVDIRVTGLAIGLEFEDGAYAGALAGRCLKAGLILGIDDGTLTLFPALTISRRIVHEGLDILERCL
jgi:4-aminobutyrate aminotransferase-like enzyme